jgi:hypothetical protein
LLIHSHPSLSLVLHYLQYLAILPEHLETLMNYTTGEELDVHVLRVTREPDKEYTILFGTNTEARDAALRALISDGYFNGGYRHVRLDVHLDETKFKGNYEGFLRHVPTRLAHYTYDKRDRASDILVTHFARGEKGVYNVTISCSSVDVFDEVVLVFADRGLHNNELRGKYVGPSARLVRPYTGQSVCMEYVVHCADADKSTAEKGDAAWRVNYAREFPKTLVGGAEEPLNGNIGFLESDVRIQWFDDSTLSKAGM